MAKVMRCTTAHWQGNTFVPAGALRPEGHHEVIQAFFEVYTDLDDPPSKAKPKPKTS